jgi:DNA (cytosine-5)-methyltransferase 1
MHYYNEWDKYPAEWLRNLQRDGQIPAGAVDERSIEDVQPKDLQGVTQAHFFAGIGGWAYALRLAGWPESRPVWTASCPCQPFSAAGKAGGVGDKRHLWPSVLRLISECRPPVVFGEQVASEDGYLWLSGVRVDLERIGYAVGCSDLPACCASAPHPRQRLYWVAEPEGQHLRGPQEPRKRPKEIQGPGEDEGASAGRGRGALSMAYADGGLAGDGGLQRGREHGLLPEGRRPRFWDTYDVIRARDGGLRRLEPGTFPLVDGVPARLAKIRAYGNAIVPEVAELFIRAYQEVRGLDVSADLSKEGK